MAERIQAQASSLAKLPSEIISLVFSYLPTNRTLLLVALTCQRFRDLVEPFRYHTLKLSLKPPRVSHTGPESNQSERPSNIQQYTQLLSILSEKPYLRHYVARVSIDIRLHPWYEAFDAHYILLAMLPSSLTSLALSPPPPNLNLSNFSLLRQLKLDFQGDGYGYWHYQYSNPICGFKPPLELFFGLLDLPCLQTLVVLGLALSEPEPKTYFTKHRASPIRTLRLLDTCDTEIGVLHQILGSIAALERFTLEIEAPWESEHMITHNMASDEIGVAVSQQASTLQELNIACSNAAYFASTSSFGDLTNWSHLRRLAIPEPLICSPTQLSIDALLPQTLEDLQLQYPMGLNQGHDGDRPTRVNRLELLAERKHQRLPQLKRVIWWDQQFECWEGTHYGHEDRVKGLEAVFEKRGTAFEFLSTPYWVATPMGKADYWSVDDLG